MTDEHEEKTEDGRRKTESRRWKEQMGTERPLKKKAGKAPSLAVPESILEQ
jgi:hypothetical protein